MTPLLTAYLQAWKQYFDFQGKQPETILVVHARSSTGHIDGDRRGDRHKQPRLVRSVLQPHQFYPNARHLSSAFA